MNKVFKWLRVIHRDLGFMMVGLSIVYGVSGMYLNHIKDTDPAFHTKQGTLHFPTGLDSETLTAEIDVAPIKKILVLDSEHLQVLMDGGIGVYNINTGDFDYETHKRKPIVYWVNRLHYNRLNGWSFMGDIFAISLITLAITGAVIVRGKKGITGRGLIYLLIGISIPVLYCIFG